MLKVIIPAFPRSGTSFLTGIIVRMGYNPGPVQWLKKSDQYNPLGYYECMPLFNISRKILEKLGGDFFGNIPVLPVNWTSQLENEKQQILSIVNSGKIEIFKDGPMLIIADLYDELFPDAKWIVIQRDISETFKSRFGKEISFDQWEKITAFRLARWQQTRPFSKSLNLNYKDFFIDLPGTIEKISSFLGIRLTRRQKKSCVDFFKPGLRKKN
jgi:hypothetical protein